MADALVIAAEIPFTESAFQLWLKSPVACEKYIAPHRSLPPTEHRENSTVSVAELLCEFLAGHVAIGAGYLLCRYDKARKTLQFGAHVGDGSTEDARALEQDFVSVLRCAATCSRQAKVREWVISLVRGDRLEQLRFAACGASDEDANRQELPRFLEPWLSNLPDASDLSAWVAPALLHGLKRLYHLTASPAHPISVGDWMTDGVRVYRPTVVGDDEMDGVDARTFQRVGPGFYADRSALWWAPSLWTRRPPRRLASLDGRKPRIYRPDADLPCLVILGNAAWTHPCVGSEPLKSSSVNGASFMHMAGNIFCDKHARYELNDSGLLELSRRSGL